MQQEAQVQVQSDVGPIRRMKSSAKERLSTVYSSFNSLITAMPTKERRQFLKPLAELKSINSLTSKTHVKRVPSGRPTGFNIKYPVLEHVLEFMGLPEDSLVSWAELTIFVNKYIHDNHLQDPEKRMIILPDERLAAILNYDEAQDAPLTYKTMQKKLRNCYPHLINKA